MSTSTDIADAFDPSVAYTAEQDVHAMYDTSMPAIDHNHRGRRPMRSTRRAPKMADAKLKICRMPLINVLSKDFVMPIELSINER